MTSRTPLPEEALRLQLPLETLTAPLDLPALFGREAPLAVEVGTGNGWFLEAEAARLPEWNFIGIERELEFYHKMLKRVARAGLTNVLATPTDATDFLPVWLAERSVARLYCYFSDPWPKRRHAERRVFTAANMPIFERALAPGAELHFKTDVGWFFNLTLTVFRRREAWVLEAIGRRPPPDAERGEVTTNFERRARAAGVEVWGFVARRREE